MKILPLVLVLATSTFGSVATPASAQSISAAEQQCRLAVSAAEDFLINGRRLWITDVFVNRIANYYTSYPRHSPLELTIGIDGDTAPDMMFSPRLFTSATEIIFQGCPEVGLVTFVVANTDWAISFSLIGNQVKEFECVDAGQEGPIRWGYTECL